MYGNFNYNDLTPYDKWLLEKQAKEAREEKEGRAGRVPVLFSVVDNPEETITAPSFAADGAVKKRGLNKKGKIMLAIYVILILLLALTLIIRSSNDVLPFGDVGASTETPMATVGSAVTIEPMEDGAEEQESESNWFDKLSEWFK
jgi:hypothetical protein